MMRSVAFASSLLVAGIMLPQTAPAAPFSSDRGHTASGATLIEQAQYRRRCGYWRRECARRWGWGGWRFRRCLARHACWRVFANARLPSGGSMHLLRLAKYACSMNWDRV